MAQISLDERLDNEVVPWVGGGRGVWITRCARRRMAAGREVALPGGDATSPWAAARAVENQGHGI